MLRLLGEQSRCDPGLNGTSGLVRLDLNYLSTSPIDRELL